jgi:hypothetical protein
VGHEATTQVAPVDQIVPFSQQSLGFLQERLHFLGTKHVPENQKTIRAPLADVVFGNSAIVVDAQNSNPLKGPLQTGYRKIDA